MGCSSGKDKGYEKLVGALTLIQKIAHSLAIKFDHSQRVATLLSVQRKIYSDVFILFFFLLFLYFFHFHFHYYYYYYYYYYLNLNLILLPSSSYYYYNFYYY